jgi:small subunit ribosomal protein S20
MANTRSASKRARQTTARALRNRAVLTRLRRMQKGISAGAAKPEAKDVRAMISAIDKAAKRGIIHKNAAKRRKARLNKSLGAASAANAPSA